MFKHLLGENKYFISCLTLALGICSVGILHADDQTNPQTSPSTYDFFKQENANSGVSDLELAQNVRYKLQSGWFSTGYDQVNVRVNQGVVTLDGPVDTLKDKEKVENEVRAIAGVKSIDNQLTVREPAK